MSSNDFRKMLDDVNFRVNRGIRYEKAPGWQFQEWPKDKNGYHSGDCDSYAITKAMELQKMGIEPRRMAIVATRLDNGDDHALLRITSPEGKYTYLDNRYPNVLDKMDGEIKGIFPHNSWSMIRKKTGQPE